MVRLRTGRTLGRRGRSIAQCATHIHRALCVVRASTPPVKKTETLTIHLYFRIANQDYLSSPIAARANTEQISSTYFRIIHQEHWNTLECCSGKGINDFGIKPFKDANQDRPRNAPANAATFHDHRRHAVRSNPC